MAYNLERGGLEGHPPRTPFFLFYLLHLKARGGLEGHPPRTPFFLFYLLHLKARGGLEGHPPRTPFFLFYLLHLKANCYKLELLRRAPLGIICCLHGGAL